MRTQVRSGFVERSPDELEGRSTAVKRGRASKAVNFFILNDIGFSFIRCLPIVVDCK
jgi:hypothetical protein